MRGSLRLGSVGANAQGPGGSRIFSAKQLDIAIVQEPWTAAYIKRGPLGVNRLAFSGTTTWTVDSPGGCP